PPSQASPVTSDGHPGRDRCISNTIAHKRYANKQSPGDTALIHPQHGEPSRDCYRAAFHLPNFQAHHSGIGDLFAGLGTLWHNRLTGLINRGEGHNLLYLLPWPDSRIYSETTCVNLLYHMFVAYMT
ncbi:hypothetical protein PHLCEN_2v11449, partial [Hermanssonia centrifuga]